MHQQIYARRQDVNAICRFLSPQVMALAAIGATPRGQQLLTLLFTYVFPALGAGIA